MGLITTLVVEHIVLEIFHDGEESTARCIGDGLAIGAECAFCDSSCMVKVSIIMSGLQA